MANGETTSHSQKATGQSKLLVAATVLAALCALASFYFSFFLPSMEFADRVANTKKLYQPMWSDDGSFVLRSHGDPLEIEQISLRPRFEISGQYSDRETLGVAVVFDSSQISLLEAGAAADRTVRGALSTLCQEPKANRTRCENGFPIKTVHWTYTMTGGTTHSGWLAPG